MEDSQFNICLTGNYFVQCVTINKIFSLGYAEVMVIPKGSTSVFLSDETWNYLGRLEKPKPTKHIVK